MSGHGIQHYSTFAKQVVPKEAYTMLPYSLLSRARTQLYVCRYTRGLFPFTALSDLNMSYTNAQSINFFWHDSIADAAQK